MARKKVFRKKSKKVVKKKTRTTVKTTKKTTKKKEVKKKKKRKSNLYESKAIRKRKKGVVVRTTTSGVPFTPETIVELVKKRKVPVFIKHCVLRVAIKLGGKNNMMTFQKSYIMCIDCFHHYGFMHKNSNHKLTFNGVVRARVHYREGVVNVQKNKQFYIYFNRSMKKYIEEYDKNKKRKK